ncbi:MAG: GH116 family glycosyl hydrolase [Candidatus Omnitrophica bacterium]|nr:GH116 family glycosyl hydrolase [Candidatus Omnitrophota bacterium]MDD5574601.1 GH116 family glycosyl hydrolase [Candidatus Omnitrophota bacterium]
MPTYTSDQNVKSGIPLGGLGAGKMEIMPNGGLDHFTFLNSLHRPVVSSDPSSRKGILGFHFALFAATKKKKVSRILETQVPPDYSGVSSIVFDGRYPFARLQYRDEELPVRCELEAFSPLVPQDEKKSGTPAAIFRFKVTNPTRVTAAVSLMACGRNIIGDWAVGRFNQVADTPDILSLNFFNKKTQGQDPLAGEMSLGLVKSRKLTCTYLGEWNMQSRPFVFDKNGFSLGEAWAAFSRDGALPNVNTERAVASESIQLGGALAAQAVLKPGQSVTVTFFWAWHFGGYAEGKMYENWFRGVHDINGYIAKNAGDLYETTRAWTRDLLALRIDDWIKDALLNNLYPFSSGSHWTKRERFGFFEAPEVCPLLGTLDVRFFASVALGLFFPQMDLKEITQFAEAQRPQGYIPHDLGNKRSDLASNSTNGLLWKDLNSKFILLVWRGYLLTGDEAFLKRMYPFVKKAFYWLASTDKNKDFLPDNEGADTTFDLWNFYGASAYAGGVFLAALLALEQMSVHMKDEELAGEARRWFKNGRSHFEKKLWHKNYFLAYNDTKKDLSDQQLSHQLRSQKVNISCTASQLVGQWVAHLLGLGYIVSPEKVKKALQTIMELNGSVSGFGAVNAVLPSGEKDKSNGHAENVWISMTYVLASLALYEGMEKEACVLAKKAWDNVAGNIMNPWNQPDMVSSVDGSFMFGDHYMRNMSFWAFAIAYARKHKDMAAFLKRIRNGERTLF